MTLMRSPYDHIIRVLFWSNSDWLGKTSVLPLMLTHMRSAVKDLQRDTVMHSNTQVVLVDAIDHLRSDISDPKCTSACGTISVTS